MNMNSYLKIVFLLIALGNIVSCTKTPNESKTTTPVVEPTSATSGDDDGGGTVTYSKSCTGTSEDGYNDLNNATVLSPLRQFSIALGGDVAWLPGNPPIAPSNFPSYAGASYGDGTPVDSANDCTKNTSCSSSTLVDKCYYCEGINPIPGLVAGKKTYNSYVSNTYVNPIETKKAAWKLFQTDGPLHIRVRLDDPAGYHSTLQTKAGAFCYGRTANSIGTYVPYPYPFKKIKFRVSGVVIKKNPACFYDKAPLCTEKDFTITSEYQAGIYEAAANKCSSVIRVDNIADTSNDEVMVVKIDQVQTDIQCVEKANGASITTCGFTSLKGANCWFGTLQVATNKTEFFKGSSR